MKTLLTYLTESIQELYHFTNAENLIGIIEDDTWICSQEYDGEIYISTTRMKYGASGYPTQLLNSSNVIRIVFDGRKLNSKYRIRPVDKMRGKRMAIKANWSNPTSFDANKSEIMKQGNVEAEDRVFINTEEIKDVHKYIKSIHIDLSNIESKYIKDIETYCNEFDIELKKYKNTKEFNLGH
jgi:hypothetical protein